MENKQLPIHIMKIASKGIACIANPCRLRILEYLDINETSSVLKISTDLNEEQIIISQNLKKLRDNKLVKTNKQKTFVYYSIDKEYPASLFICIRKLYGFMSNKLEFLEDNYKKALPNDFIILIANRMKLFSHFDKMRILEYLTLKGESCVSDIVNGTNIIQLKVSQYLKKMKEDEFVKFRRDGRFVYYNITKGIHKTVIQCIHKRYNSLENKEEF